MADAEVRQREVVMVPVLALRPGESPRLEGEDKAHIARLAQTAARLPPILVERTSLRVIDGMHRLLAASLKGEEMIAVEFFDGTSTDAFLRAVEANVKHGLPLSLADRRAAAARIVVTHPYMSDRAIGGAAGLAARTVASIRRHSTDAVPHLNARVGRDGRVRPLSSADGRRRAAELMAQHPSASLREVARVAGLSPTTARDVRRRMERGQEPVSTHSGGDLTAPDEPGEGAQVVVPTFVLEKLLRDPSLRHNEKGRLLLRLLQHNAVGSHEWSEAISAVPAHSAGLVLQLARQYANMWLKVASELDERMRIIDPRVRRAARPN
jgi:hypothetical protein